MIKLEFQGIDYMQFDRRQVRSAMGKAARAIAKQLKAAINKRSGGGRTYRRKGRNYTASAPGQPPVRFSGNLVRSVQGRASRRGYALVVQAIAPHSRLMELGWRRGAPRPFFAPTFAGQAAVVQDLLRAAVGDGLTVVAGNPGQPPKSVEIN